MIDHQAVITVESERFVGAIEAAAEGTVVPTASAWSADDLLWHLAHGQWFWSSIVGGRLDAPDAAESALPARPAGRAGLAALARAATQALVDALAGADDTEPVWTWADDRTVGLIRRRQLHEVVIHRVDAELAAGLPVSPIDEEIAIDGIDEVFAVFVSGVPDWMTFTPDGTAVAVELTGGGVPAHRWSYAFGRAIGTPPDGGAEFDLPALDPLDPLDGVAPDATIRGSACDVFVWLWGRGPLAPLTVEGDPTIAERLRAVVADATAS